MSRIISPEWLMEFPECRRVNIGCPDNPRTESLQYGSLAHAHWAGWLNGHICFSGTWKDMDWDDEYPSGTFLHEYAHLVAGLDKQPNGKERPHGPKWREAAEALWKQYGYRFPFTRRWRAHEIPLRGDALRRAYVEEVKKNVERKRAVSKCRKQGHQWIRWGAGYQGSKMISVRMRCDRCGKKRKGTKNELMQALIHELNMRPHAEAKE